MASIEQARLEKLLSEAANLNVGDEVLIAFNDEDYWAKVITTNVDNLPNVRYSTREVENGISLDRVKEIKRRPVGLGRKAAQEAEHRLAAMLLQVEDDMPSPALADEGWIGRKVTKDFPGMGAFTGTVQSFDKGLFLVEYSDGDMEEYTQVELLKIVEQHPKTPGRLASDLHPAPCVPNPPSQNPVPMQSIGEAPETPPTSPIYQLMGSESNPVEMEPGGGGPIPTPRPMQYMDDEDIKRISRLRPSEYNTPGELVRKSDVRYDILQNGLYRKMSAKDVARDLPLTLTVLRLCISG